MLKRPLPRALAWAVLPCLFLSACALADKIRTKQTPVESRPMLAEGDFAKALDDFKAAYEKTPRDKELTADYVRTVEEIKGAADRALGQQEYARAGGIYRILLDRYDDFGPFAAKLTFKKTQLETALKECRIGAVDNPAAQAVKTGDFARALDIFQAAFKENPGDVELAAKYQGTVHEIKAIGDDAFAAKNFARAGGIYRVLLDRYGDFGPFAATLTFKKVQLETALKECRIVTVDNPAAQAMKAGNFVRALDIFQAALKENPGDVELAAKYRGAVNQIKAVGDKAFSARDFARAGTVNSLLLKSYPSFERLKPPVAFSREALRDVIVACRESLTKTGLAEYRKGNLATAIAVWEGLLSFDPDNAEIKKAVNTAKTQLAGIKKKQ
jgi:tetratricopeptide (TPR) repeat protein